MQICIYLQSEGIGIRTIDMPIILFIDLVRMTSLVIHTRCQSDLVFIRYDLLLIQSRKYEHKINFFIKALNISLDCHEFFNSGMTSVILLAN